MVQLCVCVRNYGWKHFKSPIPPTLFHFSEFLKSLAFPIAHLVFSWWSAFFGWLCFFRFIISIFSPNETVSYFLDKKIGQSDQSVSLSPRISGPESIAPVADIIYLLSLSLSLSLFYFGIIFISNQLSSKMICNHSIVLIFYFFDTMHDLICCLLTSFSLFDFKKESNFKLDTVAFNFIRYQTDIKLIFSLLVILCKMRCWFLIKQHPFYDYGLMFSASINFLLFLLIIIKLTTISDKEHLHRFFRLQQLANHPSGTIFYSPFC